MKGKTVKREGEREGRRNERREERKGGREGRREKNKGRKPKLKVYLKELHISGLYWFLSVCPLPYTRVKPPPIFTQYRLRIPLTFVLVS